MQIGQDGTRVRIWDVPSILRCPIVGTCLSGKELAKLIRKVCQPVDGFTAYEIHMLGVQSLRGRCPLAKAMEKYLDKKYSLNVKQVARSEPTELLGYWEAALKDGRVSGPLWALATRKDTPEDVMKRVFEDVHMMSHLLGAERRADLREAAELREKIRSLTAENDRLRKATARAKERADHLRDRKYVVEEQVRAFTRENDRLRKANIALDGGDEVKRLRDETSQLATRVQEKDRQIRELRRATERQAAIMAEMEEGIEKLEELSLEHVEETPSCPLRDKQAEACARRVLGDRRVLLVGGREQLAPHYRRVVEEFGASFIRHDGDVRNGQTLLEEQISAADLVLCPVDCNSHNASKCVKETCKRLEKTHLFPRNSSVSMLSRSLRAVSEDSMAF